MHQQPAARERESSPIPSEELLRINDLHTHFFTYAGVVKAVNGFSLSIARGEMSALVGESGSGKSVTAWSILGLPKRPGKIVAGEIWWQGRDVLKMSPSELRCLRGQEISLILANPRSNLHPLLRVGQQVKAVHQAHQKIPDEQAREATLSMLKAVGLPDPNRVYSSYPHELSGGMAQRIVIAMALINSPELVIADDATNGLDMTVQRQVLDLMADLIKRRNAASLMITHDLGIVAQYCQRATIMYAGEAVEVAPTKRLFELPLHPYTQALLSTIRSKSTKIASKPLSGIAPDPVALPSGCPLEPRCPVRLPECKQVHPPLVEVEPDHWVRCLRVTDSPNPRSYDSVSYSGEPILAADRASTSQLVPSEQTRPQNGAPVTPQGERNAAALGNE